MSKEVYLPLFQQNHWLCNKKGSHIHCTCLSHRPLNPGVSWKSGPPAEPPAEQADRAELPFLAPWGWLPPCTPSLPPSRHNSVSQRDFDKALSIIYTVMLTFQWQESVRYNSTVTKCCLCAHKSLRTIERTRWLLLTKCFYFSSPLSTEQRRLTAV